MSDMGFVRISLCSPQIEVGNIKHNLQLHKKFIQKVAKQGAQIIVFPELSLTGYTCADLFHNSYVADTVLESLQNLADISKKYPDKLIVVGLPYPHNGLLYNCAAVFNGGALKGLVAKTYLPNYNEFKEEIYFATAPSAVVEVNPINSHNVPLSNSLVFKDTHSGCGVGIEICEDLWAPETPSTAAALNGAEVIINLSASNELLGKATHRNQLIKVTSQRLICAYCFVSAGASESTSETVFGGHHVVYENGQLIAELPPFSANEYITFDVDVELINNRRRRNTTWKENVSRNSKKQHVVNVLVGKHANESLRRPLNKYPFLPYHPNVTSLSELFSQSLEYTHQINLLCSEAFSIQTNGLAKRILRSGAQKVVINLSGGVDSTLALLVSIEATKIGGKSLSDIIALTLPGPGTSTETNSIVKKLCRLTKIHLRELPINDLVASELELIGHKGNHDVTFENVQARIRTQLALNVCNLENGILVGTGDLSEVALGWMTYGGDQLSSYNVNASLPKTLIQVMLRWYAETQAPKQLKQVIYDVLAQPISPELKPKDQGVQATEELIGPYELHDFFLYHFLVNFFSPQKIKFLAERAFVEKYDAQTIDKWLKLFFSRFFKNQFKRTAMPDGPKVTDISLSPRSQWRMPADLKFTWEIT